MDARKDITDMSFEEFFSEQKVKKEKESARVEAAKAKKEASMGEHQPGFQGSGPKLNFIDGKVMVYIPRYTASENSRFEVAVEVGEDVVTMGRLDSVKQKSNRVSRPDTKDITGVGVKPFGGFAITIDGEKETRKNVAVLVQATLLDDAVFALKQVLKSYDCELISIAKTPIMDILHATH